MIGPVVGLWIILAGAGSALLDLPPHIGKGKPSPVEYRAWAANGIPDRKTGVCPVRVFALVTREKVVRIEWRTGDWVVDWSGHIDSFVPPGMLAQTEVVFKDKDTGEVLATRNVGTSCPMKGASSEWTQAEE